jgi:hypothetical protein
MQFILLVPRMKGQLITFIFIKFEHCVYYDLKVVTQIPDLLSYVSQDFVQFMLCSHPLASMFPNMLEHLLKGNVISSFPPFLSQKLPHMVLITTTIIITFC